MKKAFFVLVAIIFGGINVYSQTTADIRDAQWDFFRNVIPKQKSITFSGGGSNTGWTMTIDDKYKVTFSGSWSFYQNDDYFRDRTGYLVTYGNFGYRGSASFNGKGFVSWENEKMKIEITVNASGTNESVYLRTDREGYCRSQEFDSASGSVSIPCTFDLIPEYTNGNFTGRLQLQSAKQLSLDMPGRTARKTISFTVGGSNWYTATVVSKTESELNASSGDEFGEWSWNADRTRLFLKSQSSDNKFVILNNNGTLTWCMEIAKNSKGSSESTTDTGDKLVNLAMAFDGVPAQNFLFIENTAGISDPNFTQLDYVVYNRFLGTMDKNPEIVLNQIKEKQMLILTYSVNNAQRTDMFLLDGLATILEYLKR